MTYIRSSQIETVVSSLVEEHGEAAGARIRTGVERVARFWKKTDGDAEVFTTFCRDNFISDPEMLEMAVQRFDKNMESILGHQAEMARELKEVLDLEMGPVIPLDYLFAGYSPGAHSNEDLFTTKVAFFAMLNFPIRTLEEKLTHGADWSRLEWAEARLAEAFSVRIPPEVTQRLDQAYLMADDYIAHYYIHMHHCLTEDGERLFPAGKKLITHWNLRDELKAHYANPDGLRRQEMILTVMNRIVSQEIPEAVIDNPAVDWIVASNEVRPTAVMDVDGIEVPESVDASPEPDTRYQRLLDVFNAEQGLDPYYPEMPTHIARRFGRDREIPEEKVESLFRTLMTSPQIERTARLIEKRLGRKLRPFDIWYDGFKAKGTMNEADLDRITRRRYPTAAAFEGDLPRILRGLGFSRQKANFLASKVAVDASRGAGHASEAGRRADKAHLRTHISSSGMDYKGYNIAVHEFGHNCEQVFTLNAVDYTLLRGVPNNAFTEAFAFVFQARDLELLGIHQEDPMAEYLTALENLWSAYEIMGVSLMDMRVWHWMYEHQETTVAALKSAVIRIAREVWNEFYAPVFGVEDVSLLAIYSHLIAYGLYLPDYPLGHVIAFQIEEYLKDKNLGREMERMCIQGRLTPDLWMQNAVSEPISVAPMLEAAEAALDKMGA